MNQKALLRRVLVRTTWCKMRRTGSGMGIFTARSGRSYEQFPWGVARCCQVCVACRIFWCDIETEVVVGVVICEHFPLLWCPLHVLEGYVTETLAVADYVPVLRDRLLAIVFERIVLIDSEIRVEDLEACLRKAEEEEEGVFAMEDDDVSNGAMVNAKQDQRELKAMERVRELADKVDATMKILFKYCDNQCAKGPRHATSFVQLVLNLFDRFVLRSKTCAFAQFTMFFICKKRTEFCDMFVNRVLAYIIAVDTEKELRKQSIAYLASFVARARYMRKEAVGSTVRELVSWLLRYVERFEKGEQKSASAYGLDGRVQGALNPNEHVEYFLVWQSVVYIMIYKGGDVSEDQLKRIPWVGLEQHLLNPFPFLPSYLVEEFVNFVVSRQEAFQFDYQTKEDLSSRLCKPPVGQLGKWYDQHAATLLTLDYPFDPCLLEVTAKTVEQDYQRWFTMESDEQEEYAMESEDEDVDELSDGEFSNKQLLVDPSRLPPAIRIPGLASGAMALLGAGKQKDGGIAYWGFSRPSLTSSIESNHLSHRVGSHISKGSPRSADVVMDDASSSVTSSFNQIDAKLGGAAAHFTRRNSQDLEDSASQLSGSW